MSLPFAFFQPDIDSNMSRLTLAQQLKQLEDEDKPRSIDPESAYTSLDGLEIKNREGDEGREHYLDVGPSKLRTQTAVGGTLYGGKYAGETRGRVKIFDDDEEEEEGDAGGFDEGNSEDESEGEEDDDEEEDEDFDDEGEEDEDAEEAEDDDEGEECQEENDGVDEDGGKEEETRPTPSSSKPKALDPMGSLRESRQKDIIKGQGIRRQKVSHSLSHPSRDSRLEILMARVYSTRSSPCESPSKRRSQLQYPSLLPCRPIRLARSRNKECTLCAAWRI